MAEEQEEELGGRECKSDSSVTGFQLGCDVTLGVTPNNLFIIRVSGRSMLGWSTFTHGKTIRMLQRLFT